MHNAIVKGCDELIQLQGTHEMLHKILANQERILAKLDDLANQSDTFAEGLFNLIDPAAADADEDACTTAAIDQEVS